MALLSTDLKGFLENAAIELEEIFNNTCAFPRINQLLVECVGEMTAEIERMRGNAWLLCTSQQKTTTLQKATTVTKSEDVTKTAHVQYIQCLLHHHSNYSNNLTCTWNNVSLHSAISFLCKCYLHVSCWATSVCGHMFWTMSYTCEELCGNNVETACDCMRSTFPCVMLYVWTWEYHRVLVFTQPCSPVMWCFILTDSVTNIGH